MAGVGLVTLEAVPAGNARQLKTPTLALVARRQLAAQSFDALDRQLKELSKQARRDRIRRHRENGLHGGLCRAIGFVGAVWVQTRGVPELGDRLEVVHPRYSRSAR